MRSGAWNSQQNWYSAPILDGLGSGWSLPDGKRIAACLDGDALGQQRLADSQNLIADFFEQWRSVLSAQSMASDMIRVLLASLGIDREQLFYQLHCTYRAAPCLLSFTAFTKYRLACDSILRAPSAVRPPYHTQRRRRFGEVLRSYRKSVPSRLRLMRKSKTVMPLCVPYCQR